MALTPTPILTRSTSMPELSRLGHETLPRNLTRSASLLDVSTPTPCSAEPQTPDVISSAPCMLEAGEPKSISESKPDKRKKSSKKSNKISTEKKAMLHLAAVTGAVTIGAALAPFTLGFSLLPTVFVVMYGNASAMAMYGGSQFVTGEQEKKKPDPKRAASTPTPDNAPKHPFPFPPLAALPCPNDSKDTETETGVGRGDTFNNCFNTVNNYHKNWYVFINAPNVPASHLVPEELGHTPSEPSTTKNIRTTQTTDTSSIELITRPFADAVTVTEMTAQERQARLKILIAGRTEQTDPNLSSLLRSLDQGDDTCAQMVEITGKDGATAYAVIPKGDILIPHGQDRGTQVVGPNGSLTVSNQTDVTQAGETNLAATEAIGAQTIKGYNGRKWQVAIPTPVSLTNGAQTGSNYTQGPRHNLNLDPSAGLELASAVIPKGDILVPHGQERGTQVFGIQADGSQTERADDSANRAVTVSTQPMATQTGETHLAATEATGAQTIKGYNGRKWQVAIPTPVSLTNGAQTGSNYTQGPRHNLNLGPSAGLELASVVIPKGDILVPHGQERGTQVVGIQADGSQTERADDSANRAVTVSTQPMATQTGETHLAATEAIGAQTIKGYNGRKWQVAIPTPVSLTNGAQTGSNYTQGPRHNLNLGSSAGLELVSAVIPKGDILVPHGLERGTQVVGTQADGSQTERADDSANSAVTVSPHTISTQTSPESLDHDLGIGPQTFTSVERSEATLRLDRKQIQLHQSELSELTSTPGSKVDINRKWQVAIPTPVSLTNGAQTGSNYTQGPRRNLNLGANAGLDSGLAPTFDGVEDLSVQQPKDEMSISADQFTNEMNIGLGALASVERSEAEIRVIRQQLEIKTPAGATSTIALAAEAQFASPTISTVTSTSKATLKAGVLAPQKSASKPALDLDKIESRIVGRAGGHIQYKVPKFLDRPEAGTFMGSWRPIPESLQGKRDSVEFAAWRENDLAQYLKSLNPKVLLTQGAVSMRGQNHFAGKMNNVRERAEIKSQLTPMKHMNRADHLQFTGLNSSNGRSHLLETPSGKLRVTPPVTLSNLVSAP